MIKMGFKVAEAIPIVFIILLLLSCCLSTKNNCENFNKEIFKQDDLYLCSNRTYYQNSSEHKNENVCSTWCRSEDVNWTKLNSTTGNIYIDLPISPSNCYHDEFIVFLYEIQSPCNGNLTSATKELHSSKNIRIKQINCGTKLIPQVIKLKFTHVFTGCYYLSIRPEINGSMEKRCNSKFFKIETNYNKQMLTKISLKPRYSSSSSDFSITVFGGSVFSTQKIRLFFRHEEKGKRGYAWILPNQNGKSINYCCYSEFEKSYCECMQDIHYLSCKFTNSLSGNYSYQIELFDTRCTKRSLWGNGEECLVQDEFEINSTVNNILPSQMPNSGSHTYWIYTALILLIIITSIILIFVKYWKPPSTLEHKLPKPICPPKQEELSKICLLYPRDCQLFMSTMISFRKLLVDSLKTQVYDIWDEEIFEDVASIGEIWALNLLRDPKVKVILVASKCSRLLEEAFLCGKKIIYAVPNHFDSTFLMAIRCLLTSSIADSINPYKKISIIRLDDMDFEENKFQYVNPYTVYTIPQQLHGLIFDLKYSGCFTRDYLTLGPERVLELKLSLMELDNFKRKNPNYLDEVLKIS